MLTEGTEVCMFSRDTYCHEFKIHFLQSRQIAEFKTAIDASHQRSGPPFPAKFRPKPHRSSTQWARVVKKNTFNKKGYGVCCVRRGLDLRRFPAN